MFTTRVLPPEEWPKLSCVDNDLSTAWPRLPTDGVTIVVVEDEAGAIVATWSAFQCTHLESVWVAEDHRKRGVVAGRLRKEMFTTLRARGILAAITNAASPEVAQLLERLKATRVPGEQYVLTIGED